mmetsp:Transcript_7963/g.18788  ORF Transcript_7963/g.18788 Transcript_7963/m.18788 type:complete len:389 (-) Transcript_7963:39-1205(-)
MVCAGKLAWLWAGLTMIVGAKPILVDQSTQGISIVQVSSEELPIQRPRRRTPRLKSGSVAVPDPVSGGAGLLQQLGSHAASGPHGSGQILSFASASVMATVMMREMSSELAVCLSLVAVGVALLVVFEINRRESGVPPTSTENLALERHRMKDASPDSPPPVSQTQQRRPSNSGNGNGFPRDLAVHDPSEFTGTLGLSSMYMAHLVVPTHELRLGQPEFQIHTQVDESEGVCTVQAYEDHSSGAVSARLCTTLLDASNVLNAQFGMIKKTAAQAGTCKAEVYIGSDQRRYGTIEKDPTTDGYTLWKGPEQRSRKEALKIRGVLRARNLNFTDHNGKLVATTEGREASGYLVRVAEGVDIGLILVGCIGIDLVELTSNVAFIQAMKHSK